MKFSTNKIHKIKTQRGQSLVEVALFFPIFIIMLAGLVEVSNLLVTQNRVSSATRSSTRFAANGGEDAGVATVLLNTVTQTLNFEQEYWDVWSIRGTINEQGTAINQDSWQFTHVYGYSNTQKAIDVDEAAIQADILAELQRDEFGNSQSTIAADLRFVATFAIHDVDSILGLDAMPALVGLTSVQELTVMRFIGFDLQSTDGCAAFPLAVNSVLRTMDYPGQGGNPFPPANQFQYPAMANNYYDFFFGHPRPGVTPKSILDAQEGYIFQVGGPAGGAPKWLVWNDAITDNAATLSTNMTFPGRSDDYTSTAPDGNVYGYFEPGDPSDNAMHVNDRVKSSTVSGSSITSVLNSHIDNERALRFIIYTTTDTGNPSGNPLIARFAVFRIVGYNMSANWLLLEFVRYDDSCGQQ